MILYAPLVEYKKENIVMKSDNELEFVTDTVYNWNDELVPAIYFENNLRIEFEHKYVPFIGGERGYPGYAIYAKDLGLVKYGTQLEGEIVEWKLEEIKKTKIYPFIHLQSEMP